VVPQSAGKQLLAARTARERRRGRLAGFPCIFSAGQTDAAKISAVIFFEL